MPNFKGFLDGCRFPIRDSCCNVVVLAGTMRRMDEFAQHTYTRDGLQLTSEQRLALSLTDPGHPAAMSPSKVEKVTKNQIRNALANLAHGKIDQVGKWLDEVAKDSPAAAIDRLIELLKFTTPQVKAIAMDVRSGDGSVKTYTSAELQSIVNGGE